MHSRRDDAGRPKRCAAHPDAGCAQRHEHARASARYRSTFLGDFTGFGGSPTRRTALGETIIDAQIGYDFQDGSALDGLSIYLQGQNLTDERFASVGGNGSHTAVSGGNYAQYTFIYSSAILRFTVTDTMAGRRTRSSIV